MDDAPDTLPPYLVDALAARRAGEVLATLALDPGDDAPRAWAVATETGAWVVTAPDHVRRVDGLALERGWRQDALLADGDRLPLPRGRRRAARRLAKAVPPRASALQRRAALAEEAGAPDAGHWWREAAEALHDDEQPTAARAALSRALGPSAPAGDRWRAAAWAWADAASEDAREHWRHALAADPPGAWLDDADLVDPAGWRALADEARAAQAATLEAHALARVVAAHPRDAALAGRLADVLVTLDRKADAATVLERCAAHLEEARLDEDAARPDGLWLRAAGLRQGDVAREDLVHAVQSGFLHGAVWKQAAAHPDAPPARAAWWRHVAGLLDGDDAPGALPATTVDADGRDALDPGSRGWLATLRDTLDPPSPPDRAALVRGLERLEHADPAAHTELLVLARALGTPAPDAFVVRGDQAWGLAAWPTVPPVLLLGHDHLAAGPRRLEGASLRFALAVELAHLACDHPPLDTDPTLAGTTRALYGVFGRHASTAETVVDLVTLVPGVDHLARIERILRASRKVFAARSAVDKAAGLAEPWLARWLPTGGGGVGREGLQGAALQLRLHADRIALRLTGDVGGAVRAILRTSGTSLPLDARVAREGLAAVLDDPSSGLADDTLTRITALLAWASREDPGAWPRSDQKV